MDKAKRESLKRLLNLPVVEGYQPAALSSEALELIADLEAAEQKLREAAADVKAYIAKVDDLELALKAHQQVTQQHREDTLAAEEKIGRFVKDCQGIEQTLGQALGYPWYKNDPINFPNATEAQGVCVGDHVPGSLAAEAAQRIRVAEERLRIATEALRKCSDPRLMANGLNRIAENALKQIEEPS